MDYTPEAKLRIIAIASELMTVHRAALVEKAADLALSDEQCMGARRQQHRAEHVLRELAVAAHRVAEEERGR